MSTATRKRRDFELDDGPDWDYDEMPPGPVRRFTVEEFQELVRLGFFAEDEKFELLEGWIVRKMVKNPPHEVAIDLATDALKTALPRGWRVRNQSSIVATRSQPEPDLCVVRGTARDYLKRHPRAEDIALVIEVADSSVARDRGLKARVYARMPVPFYWIVNLVDGCVEVYSEPSGLAKEAGYRRREVVGREGSVGLMIDGREVARIAAIDLLP